jgi:hypothetical protein
LQGFNETDNRNEAVNRYSERIRRHHCCTLS